MINIFKKTAYNIKIYLVLATLCKMILVFLFYQHAIVYDNGRPVVAKEFGWGELVSNMHQGKYEMTTQTGLTQIDMSSPGRPPIYAGMLYAVTYWTPYPAAILVFIQSIITSLVAYIGYKIVKTTTNNEKLAIWCLIVLFIFPMNFLKSGTIDEAPLTLVFILTGVYFLGQYLKDNRKISFLILSGAMLGLSILTRGQAMPIAFGIVLYLFLRKPFLHNYKHAIIFMLICACIIAPWKLRSYYIKGKTELVVGSSSNRLFLVTQSEDFIHSFPYESIDVIERRYLKSFIESHEYLKELDSGSLGAEFKRLAISEAINNPLKYFRAFITRLKVFIPYRYYPVLHSVPRDIIYVSWYGGALLFFFWSIFKWRSKKPENIVLLICIFGWILPGFICFIGSRHLYPFIVFMIIYSFVAFPYSSNHISSTK